MEMSKGSNIEAYTRLRRAKTGHGRGRKRSLRPLLITVTVIIIVAAILIERGMQTPLREIAMERVSELAHRALNDAVISVMNSDERSSELLSITDKGSDTYMIIADTAAISMLAAKMTAAAQERVARLGITGVDIPFGTVSGISLFTGLGPDINVEFTPVGSVGSKYVSSLNSSGINQSLFSIRLTLTAHVRIILGGSQDTMTVSATTPICETVIVGAVPQVYTNVANEEDMLNLIPTDLP